MSTSVRSDSSAPVRGTADPSTRPGVTAQRAARLSGVAYLVMFVLALVASATVMTRVVDLEDPQDAWAAVASGPGLVRAGALALLVVVVLDVVLAWGLHVILRRVDRDVSLAAAWFRLAYSAVLAVAVAQLLVVLRLVDGAAGPASDATVLAAASALESFHATWMLGLALFGMHLVLVGVLLRRSRLTPAWMGPLLVVAGSAYVLDTVLRIALPDYDAVSATMLVVVAVPSVVGEVGLGVWLLVTRRLRALAPSA